MRIKEYGHIKPQEVKCNYCGAILEFDDTDIRYNYTNNKFYIQCPVCGKLIYKNNDFSDIKKQNEMVNKDV